MMLFVPTTYKYIKAVLLVLILISIAISIFSRGGKLSLHPIVLLLTLFMMMVGSAFMLLGLMHDAPGALRVGTVHVLWPFVFTVMVTGAANEKILVGLLRTLVIATIAISLYSISFILHAAGWLPDILYVPIDQGQVVGFYQGFIEYNMYSISSLLFLVPFLVGCLFVWPKNMIMPVSRAWLLIGAVLGFAAVLLSGRRVLLLVVALSPFIVLIFRGAMDCLQRRMNRKLVIRSLIISVFGVICIYIFLQYVYSFNFQNLWNNFVQGFDFSNDDSGLCRRDQFYSLLRGWADSPVFGAGLGAATDVTRDDLMPWAYELYYVSLLFHMGIVGLFCYLFGVVWIFWMGLRILRSGDRIGLYMLPVLVGTSCFLIASATNPYIGKFDYMWVIFLPIAFINYWLIANKKGNYICHFFAKTTKKGC